MVIQWAVIASLAFFFPLPCPFFFFWFRRTCEIGLPFTRVASLDSSFVFDSSSYCSVEKGWGGGVGEAGTSSQPSGWALEAVCTQKVAMKEI